MRSFKDEGQFHWLEKEVGRINIMENKVEAMVQLFKIISPVEEKGVFIANALDLRRRAIDRNAVSRDIKSLEKLLMHFCDIRYSKFVSNIQKGEEVGGDKIILGGIFGLKDKSADYCLSRQSQLEKDPWTSPSWGVGHEISKWYIINNYQCGTFLRCHTQSILEQIKILRVA